MYDQVSQNPRDTECMQGAAIFKEKKIDLVVGIGGGSPIDTAKAIALLGPNGGEPLDYYQKKRDWDNWGPMGRFSRFKIIKSRPEEPSPLSLFNVSLRKIDDGVDELAPLVQEQVHRLWYHE